MLGAGVSAPEFFSYDLAGREVRLADFRGKVLILDFWATWCSPCIASMPHTQEIAAKYADQSVVVLAVCTGDKRQKFEDWVKLKAKSYPAMRFTFDPHEQGTPQHDQRASFALYRVPAIPAQFVIDRSGMIVGSTNGYFPGDTRLEAALAKAGVKVDAAIAARAPQDEAKAKERRANAAAQNPVAATGAHPAPPAFTEDAVRLKAGQVMADLLLRGADGAEHKVSAYRGRPLILCFSPAEQIPAEYLDAAVERYGAQGVPVLALVTRDSAESYREWLELHRGRHRFATAFDPAGAKAVGESAVFLAVGMVVPMPMVLVLDRAGKLVGKVAPKVATSTRGLAELLRRCGVPVKPEELPTPEMFPKPAAAAPAVAPKAAAAFPMPGAAESPADRDYSAFVALRSEQPPGKPKEMGGFERYIAWVDRQAQQISKAALAFHAAYPQDPRRWDVVFTMITRAPVFMAGFKPKPDDPNPGIKDVIVDEPAKQTWTAQVDQLRKDLLAATDSAPEQKESIEFSDFAAESRRLRARLQSGEDRNARASFQALRTRFDQHVARYAGNSRLAAEAENFLSAWKELVSGSYEEGWRHLSDAADAGVRTYAAEKLASIERRSRPLEMTFTAVDGRKVDLRDLRGKVVLVDFWATWCGPCIAELPNLRKVHADYHAKGFEVIGIALENAQLNATDTADQAAAKLERAKARLTAFVAKEKMPWPQYFDGKFWKTELATQYGITSIPAMLLLDQEGRLVSTSARGEALEREVKRLLKL